LYFNALIAERESGRGGRTTCRGRQAAPLAQVLFEQHPAENCILDCSKCLFVVACGSI
jgi:hypothetical protein